MEKSVLVELMLLCGCLHDISEKSNEQYTPLQIKKVEERLIILINRYFPELVET